ncbi:helix-turn-helix transcriptional regulator [Streptomyces sp. B1866]|uniref:response regulator transcription factor n=1 Tax=Streptomyces sp. B1866 TaxID=3075431 RepID=UPI0028907D73|nr:helix-turn-helix transcriptional regulator [Streptomyces sp. B1866]MDT3395902.1 helix-turn-helix transcriptional regulator [Streptomyces sp. B1866]
MLNLAVTALHEQDPERLWPPIAAELLRAYSAEFLALETNDRAGQGPVRIYLPNGTTRGPIGAHAQQLIRHRRLFADHYASSNDRAPVTACQAVGEVEWKNSAAAKLMRDTLGVDHILSLPLPDNSGPLRGCLIYRAGSGFTDEDLTYGQRIQPLLAGFERQVTLLRRWSGYSENHTADRLGFDPPKESAGAGLTPREVSVLTLLGDSLTAAAIGRRLGISVRTAQKHVESIYRKLGTKDRLSTVLRAQACGFIPAKGATAPRLVGTRHAD